MLQVVLDDTTYLDTLTLLKGKGLPSSTIQLSFSGYMENQDHVRIHSRQLQDYLLNKH